jgi:hypothetical protein
MGGIFGGVTSALFGNGGADDNAAALAAVQGVPLPILKEYYPEDKLLTLVPKTYILSKQEDVNNLLQETDKDLLSSNKIFIFKLK